MKISLRLGPRVAGLLATAGVSSFVVVALVGLRVVLHPGDSIVGSNPVFDFQLMSWSLEWWPWAILHSQDPLHTSLLWSPGGFSLFWLTSIPVPALLAVPLTAVGGPLVAYNVLAVAAVVLAACATYLLCFELTGGVLSSLAGGVLFGFSPYMLGHMLSEHLNLTFVFPIPLLALVGLRCACGETSPRRFVAWSVACLLVLAGSSAELFVDLALVIVVVGAVATVAAPSHRADVRRIGALTLIAYAVVLVVLVPFAVLALLAPHGAVQYAPASYETDLLNAVVPTSTLLLGSLRWARTATEHFSGNLGEQDGYVGIPLLVVAGIALARHWSRGAWLAGLVVLVSFVLSLGPVVALAGRPVAELPVSTAGLPVLGDALPARLSVFAALGISCLAAVWFATPRRPATTVVVGALVAISLLPNFWQTPSRGGPWARTYSWSTADAPASVASTGAWKSAIPSGANVLVLPPGDHTEASFWQVSSGMRFALAVPETPFVPPAVATNPFVSRFADGVLLQLDGRRLTTARLRAFLIADRVARVVVTPGALRQWAGIVRAATSTPAQRVRHLLVFRVPRTLAPLRCEAETATARLSRVLAVHAWLAFDGVRAQVRVRFDGRIASLSSLVADADSPAVALNRRRDAAVVFTEWEHGELGLRVATTEGGGWHVTTLSRTREPIWSPQVVVEPDGSVIVAWIVDTGSVRNLQVAVRTPLGVWRQVSQLEQGIGLGSVALAAGRRDVAVAAWQDAIASESRIRAATYRSGTWTPAHTLVTAFAHFGAVRVAASNTVSWRQWKHGRTTEFVDRRVGSSWVPAR